MEFLKDYNFEIPFDLLYLPSQGLFYPDKSPYLHIQYLTAKEEYILTSPSLSEAEMASKIVLESVVLDKKFPIDELLVGDRNAIVVFLRSTSYGDNFPLKFRCPKCSSEEEMKFGLSSLESKDIIDVPDENGLFTFELPKSKSIVKFSPLRIKDEEELNKLIDNKKKKIGDSYFKEEVTARYLIQIKSIDGNCEKEFIEKFTKRMSLIESNKLRDYMEKVEPGINSVIKFHCSSCDHDFKEDLKINDEILKLPPEHRENVNEEMFLASYYSQGGMTKDQVFRMSVSDRRWYINRISAEIDKKNKAEEAAVRKARSSSKK